MAAQPTYSDWLDGTRAHNVMTHSSSNKLQSNAANFPHNIKDSEDPLHDSEVARTSHECSINGRLEESIPINISTTYYTDASALDALASLASSMCWSPSPPRCRGRVRSSSNPEGMEKWDSYAHRSDRRHFVLPFSILEEELANANSACEKYNAQKIQQHVDVQSYNSEGPLKKKFTVSHCAEEQQQLTKEENMYDTSPTTVLVSISTEETKPPMCVTGKENHVSFEETTRSGSNINPSELLRRARSRLLGDLVSEPGTEKSVLPLPHSIEKYKEVYNKHGRIGIYTPAERAAIIARFNNKRAKRIWKKRIRYDCRKDLADRRMRVKGRFVKRSVPQQFNKNLKGKIDALTSSVDGANQAIGSSLSPIVNVPCPSLLTRANEDSDYEFNEGSEHEENLNVVDKEAGFRPTVSQPYRRVRRYTII